MISYKEIICPQCKGNQIQKAGRSARYATLRLTRKTICFSKLEVMHDTVIGLRINKVEFERDIYA